jgi:acyl-CoA reductase-like NAD-dependent aldehyde dehydrogenase
MTKLLDRNIVGGQWVASRSTARFDNVNGAIEEVIAPVPAGKAK